MYTKNQRLTFMGVIVGIGSIIAFCIPAWNGHAIEGLLALPGGVIALYLFIEGQQS